MKKTTTEPDGIKWTIRPIASRNKWRLELWPTPGATVETKTTFDNEDEAVTYKDARLAVLRFVPRASDEPTFREWCDAVLWPEQVRLNRAPGTIYGQMRLAERNLYPYWGDWQMNQISVDAVRVWRDNVLARTTTITAPFRVLSPGARKQIWMVFGKMIRAAVREKAMRENPMPQFDYEVTPARTSEPLSPEQVDALAVAIGRRNHAMVHTMAWSGVRISEACALRIDDLDFEQDLIRVDEAVVYTPGSGLRLDLLKTSNSLRSNIPLPPEAMDLLREQVKGREHRPADFVFKNRSGAVNRPASWRPAFNEAATRVGMPWLTPHWLRHTAVSLWHDRGYDIEEIAMFAGDTPETIRKTYLHLFPKSVQNRMKDFRIFPDQAAA